LIASRQVLPSFVEAAGARGDKRVCGWFGALFVMAAFIVVDTSISSVSPRAVGEFEAEFFRLNEN
jgi:hypothetical protein